jgi:uncharacterized protein YvpB
MFGVPLPPSLPPTTTVSTNLSVPFYSQFADITAPFWKGKSCGVVSLAMLLEFYTRATTTPDSILVQAIAKNGFIPNIGWTYKSLIDVSRAYGMTGSSYDLGGQTRAHAFVAFKEALESGPVIASVHYQFDPTSTIPHLVLITDITGDTLTYNDPAEKFGAGKISTTAFIKAWKKRFIVIRPKEPELAAN